MNTIENREKKEFFDIIIVFMILIYPEINKYIWIVVNMFSSVVGVRISTTVILTVIWIVIFVLYSKTFMTRIKAYDLIVYITAIIFISVFFLMKTHSYFTTQRYINLIFTVMPAYFIGRIYQYEEKDKFMLMNFASLAVVFSVIYTFRNLLGGDELLEDNMYASYLVLPAVLMTCYAFFDKECNKYIIFAIFGIIYTLILGTRGPILCIVTFVLIMFLKKVKIIKAIITMIVVVTLIISYINSDSYVKNLIKMTEGIQKLGFSARILEFAIEGEITEDSGRSTLTEKVAGKIKEHPLDMNGPYYDWAIISGDYETGKQKEDGESVYVHNFFLEIWSHYGVIVGSIFILAVVFGIIRLIKRSDNKTIFVPAVLISCSFVKLLLSSSYCLEPTFFCLLGMLSNRHMLNKKMEE